MKSYYRLAPDIAVINLQDGNILFKSDTVAVKLGGSSATFLRDEVLPKLNGNTDLESVCGVLSNVSTDDLRENLQQLVKAGVLVCSQTPLRDEPVDGILPYFTNILTATGHAITETMTALKSFKIAVIGLEAHGTQTVLALQQSGLRNFKLVDPFLCDDSYHTAFPFLAAEGSTRQSCVEKYLTSQHAEMQVESFPAQTVTKEQLETFIGDCHLLLVCADKGFSSLFYWTNQISIDKKIPALYASIKGHVCLTGPFVIPEKTSCYMCYKMRHVATKNDFEEAMVYEEYLNAQKKPAFANRSIMPAAIQHTTALLSAEITKYVFSLGPIALADKIHEFNTLDLSSNLHTVYQKPDCPVCGQKTFTREHPSHEALKNFAQPSKLGELLPGLISTETGIIKKLELVPKDISEPALPLVYMAVLANHNFLPEEQHKKLNCSGKGMDRQSAVISAGGEAVERYSGTLYFPGDIRYSTYDELSASALHPNKLVLYSSEQYEHLPFARFDPSIPLGWVKAYSLVHDKPVYVPAQSTVLNYSLQYKQEYLCQATSNGLAAGATLLDAILSAAGEVIERDAFMIAWHHELPCQRVDPLTHPIADTRELCHAYGRRGVEMQLYRLPTDAPYHVFMGIGVQKTGEGPAVTVGLGCDMDPAKAARGALLEVGQVRPAFRQRLRLPETQQRLQQLLKDPSFVEELDDHNLLYGVPDTLPAFDFLFRQSPTAFDWNAHQAFAPASQLQVLIDFLKADNSDLIYYNLTPPDMQKAGLYTARVIIPDFQPIHFGYRNVRLGGNRFFELPEKLGFRNRRVQPNELNKNPHPLA